MKSQPSPKVSIIAISYNHERYIRQALDGFLSQKTNFEFEIIVGDDCSTDNTANIIREYSDKYPEIFKPILRNKNVGLQRNFSETINKARGEYLAICECDDFWTDNNKLQIQADFLDSNPECSICFHPVNVFFEGHKDKDSIFPDRSKLKEISLKELLKQNFIQTNSVMYRNHGKLHIPDNILPVDWYLHLYYAQFGEIGYIDKVMSSYRRHEGGIWWSSNVDEFWRRNGIKHLAMYDAVLKMFDEKKEYRDALFEPISRAFVSIANVGSSDDENQLLEESFKEYPYMAADFLNYYIKEEEAIKNDKDKLINSNEAHIKKQEAVITEQMKTIQKQAEDIEDLSNRLKRITESKTWKLATKLRNTKKTITGSINL